MDNVNISKLDLNLLRTFVVLMEERNVSSASVRLRLSQSATSNALERIRESFHDRVLEREGRDMVPTRAALALWPKISAALTAIETAFDAVNKIEPLTMQAHFTIGIDEYAMALYGEELVAAITRDAPAVTLAFTFVTPGSYAERLVRNDVDLIIAPVWQQHPDIVQRHLFDEQFIGLMSSDHPLAGKKMTRKRYVSYPHVLVSLRGIVEGNVDAALRYENLSRRVSLCTPWFESAPRYLSNTGNLLNMGEKLGRKLLKNHPITEFRIPIDVPGFSVSMLWHPRHTTDAHLRWLRTVVDSVMGSVHDNNMNSQR